MSEPLPTGDRNFLKAIVVIALAITAIASGRAYTLATDVRSNSRRIEAVERLDTRAARDALYRICEREQRDRAEVQYRAIAFASLTKQLLGQLGASERTGSPLTLEATRRRLPIFDCLPNLVGKHARLMSGQEQDAYVAKYAAGKLSVSPRAPGDGS